MDKVYHGVKWSIAFLHAEYLKTPISNKLAHMCDEKMKIEIHAVSCKLPGIGNNVQLSI